MSTSFAELNGVKTSFGRFDVRIEDTHPEPTVRITKHSPHAHANPPKRKPSSGCGGCGDGVPEVIWPRLKWHGIPKPVRFWRWLLRKPKIKYKGCGCFLPFLKFNDWLVWKVYFGGFLTYGSKTPRVV
jgi:hypothetical protein